MILDFDIEIHVFYFAHTNLCLESIMMITFVFFFYLLKLGVPAKKLVIGAAFYTRIWKDVTSINNGLYQSGAATNGIDFKDFDTKLTKDKGWNYFWDEKVQAPYWYNEKERLFATGDDLKSVGVKTRYAIKKKLGGIMFWELILDKNQNGMVDAIDKVKQVN